MTDFSFLKKYVFKPTDMNMQFSKHAFLKLTEDDIENAEKSINRRFPKELKEFYRQIGYGFSLPIMLNEVFPKKGAEVFGILMSANALTVICLSLIIVAVTKKFKPLTNIIIAGIFYAIGFGMIGVISSFALFILSTFLWTIGEILVVTNLGVFIANNSPANFRARFSAFGNLSSAIGGALGTSLIGIYINFAGINAVWSLIFILSCVAVGLMIMLQSFSSKKQIHNKLNNSVRRINTHC